LEVGPCRRGAATQGPLSSNRQGRGRRERGANLASIGFGLACMGCLLLSLSLKRHYKQVFPDLAGYERRRWPMRLGGYGLLLLAIWPSVRAAGPWVGLILWLSMIALGAFIQIMLLTYRPRGTAVFGAFGAALVAIGLFL
jgi:uncharacterized protein DUF3325